MPGFAFKVVIPARYASTRLPAKPLLDLGGKPMVVRVAERARLSGAEEVWVATDHPDVWAAAEAHEVAALMTRGDHATGTDRLAEVVAQRGWHGDAIIVNVQGDEPLLVGEVTYGELTGVGRLRHPVWKGWRPDRTPDTVVWEGWGEGPGR